LRAVGYNTNKRNYALAASEY